MGIIQVVHVQDEGSVDEAVAVARTCDAVLLDSGNQSQETPELGGTGRTHDWSLSARIVASVSVPVFLAGGLNPGNVADAVVQVQPFGVDICSGVRSDQQLNPQKLAAFIAGLSKSHK